MIGAHRILNGRPLFKSDTMKIAKRTDSVKVLKSEAVTPFRYPKGGRALGTSVN